MRLSIRNRILENAHTGFALFTTKGAHIFFYFETQKQNNKMFKIHNISDSIAQPSNYYFCFCIFVRAITFSASPLPLYIILLVQDYR